MKQFLVIALVFLYGSTAYGQDSSAVKLFDKGLKYYQEKKTDSAIQVFENIIEKKIGAGTYVYGNAFFNIPALHWQLKRYDKAKEWYLKVLASDLRDNDETGQLMEPHTNYKHKSALAMAGLNERDSNYAEALNWVYKADTVYRYWGFEGSATNVSKKQEYLLNWKTDMLMKLNKQDEAIREIISELLHSSELEGFFTQSQNRLAELIANKNKFKTDLDLALKNLVVKQVDAGNWQASFTLYDRVYNLKIKNEYPDHDIPHYWKIIFVKKDTPVDTNYLTSYIKQREFYKRLSN